MLNFKKNQFSEKSRCREERPFFHQNIPSKILSCLFVIHMSVWYWYSNFDQINSCAKMNLVNLWYQWLNYHAIYVSVRCDTKSVEDSSIALGKNDVSVPQTWRGVIGDICQLPSIPRPTANPDNYIECVHQPDNAGNRLYFRIYCLSFYSSTNFVDATMVWWRRFHAVTGQCVCGSKSVVAGKPTTIWWLVSMVIWDWHT